MKEVEERDREADQIKKLSEKKMMQNKKYADVMNRISNARNHKIKTISLWETKEKVSEHEN